MVLIPPPPAAPVQVVTQSFHTISGMYPSAVARFDPLFQKVASAPPFTVSLNSVPPTDVLNGVELKPFTASWVRSLAGKTKSGSQAAAPVSPDATKTLIPCAAACSNNKFQKVFP